MTQLQGVLIAVPRPEFIAPGFLLLCQGTVLAMQFAISELHAVGTPNSCPVVARAVQATNWRCGSGSKTFVPHSQGHLNVSNSIHYCQTHPSYFTRSSALLSDGFEASTRCFRPLSNRSPQTSLQIMRSRNNPVPALECGASLKVGLFYASGI